MIWIISLALAAMLLFILLTCRHDRQLFCMLDRHAHPLRCLYPCGWYLAQHLPVKTAFNKKRSRLQSLLYKQDVEWELKVYEGKRMALSIAAAVLSLVLSLAYACNLATAARPDPADGLDRPGYGEADREYLLEVEGLGSEPAKLTVEIPAMQYAGSQIGEIMRQAGDALRNLMLGENPSADEVRTDLILPSTVKGTGIQVEWSVEYTDCLDALGHVNNGQCPEEGQLVWLEAVLKYQEYEYVERIYVRVMPPVRSEEEKAAAKLKAKLEQQAEKAADEPLVRLPDSFEGKRLKYSFPEDRTGWEMLLVLGMVCVVLPAVSSDQKLKRQQDEKQKQLLEDYPSLVAKLTVLIGAGMTVRRAWERIWADYTGTEAASDRGKRPAYEEMGYALHCMEGGMYENSAYRAFGQRCGLYCYIKLGNLLEQNLKKGSRDLLLLLRQESEAAFREQKDHARRLGQEASTKLMLPMFMMFGIVVAIVIVPVFLSFQF